MREVVRPAAQAGAAALRRADNNSVELVGGEVI